MNNSGDPSFSRRRLLELVSAASVGGGLIDLAPLTLKAQAGSSPDASHTLGLRTYNVRDFGAKGDGVTLDTDAFQQAIDACNREQGGTVLVPAGVFVIGTIELKSNVTV